MNFKTSLALFLILGTQEALNIGLYAQDPYISPDTSICGTIINKLCSDLLINCTIMPVSNESSGVECVKSGKCDATIGGFHSDLSLSYPILTVIPNQDRALILTRDLRPTYVKDIFWQYLVLIITIWVPLLIILSHFYYFFETRNLPYHIGIFRAIWLNFSVSGLKKPCSKVWAGVSWLFLLFIIVLIFADMASIIASPNTSSGYSISSINDKKTCTTIPTLLTSSVNSVEACLEQLGNGSVDVAILGRLELSTVPAQKYQHFIVYDSWGTEVFFHLLFPPGTPMDPYNTLIISYWQNYVIFQIYSKYSNFSYKTLASYSLVFQDFSVVLVGISVLVLFAGVVAVMCLACKGTGEESQKEEEPSPSSRSLLARNPSHTISLDQSISNRLGSGRPEEWVNKAVDIQDENAHKIKNIQDYENELSAVNPIAPSFGSEKSIMSLIKSTKK